MFHVFDKPLSLVDITGAYEKWIHMKHVDYHFFKRTSFVTFSLHSVLLSPSGKGSALKEENLIPLGEDSLSE